MKGYRSLFSYRFAANATETSLAHLEACPWRVLMKGRFAKIFPFLRHVHHRALKDKFASFQEGLNWAGKVEGLRRCTRRGHFTGGLFLVGLFAKQGWRSRAGESRRDWAKPDINRPWPHRPGCCEATRAQNKNHLLVNTQKGLSGSKCADNQSFC